MLEKILESPLDCKIKPVHPKGNESWIFIGWADAEAETPVLWPPNAKNWLIWKDLDAGKDWRQEEKRNNRGWDGCMASLTQWTGDWVNSASWCWTWRPSMMQSMELQSIGHNWATELNWTCTCATCMRRPPEARLKECRPCTHPDPYQQPLPLKDCYKTPHQMPPRLGHTVFEGMTLPCPPLPGKAIELFFSTSL